MLERDRAVDLIDYDGALPDLNVFYRPIQLVLPARYATIYENALNYAAYTGRPAGFFIPDLHNPGGKFRRLWAYPNKVSHRFLVYSEAFAHAPIIPIR